MQTYLWHQHARKILFKLCFCSLLAIQAQQSHAGIHDNLVRSLFADWTEQAQSAPLNIEALQLLRDFTPQSKQDEAQLALVKALHTCQAADASQCRLSSLAALSQPLNRLQQNAVRLAIIESYVQQNDTNNAWSTILRYQQDNQPLSTQDAITLTGFMLRLDDAQKASTWRTQIPKNHPYVSWLALKLQAAPVDDIWNITQQTDKAPAWQKAYVLQTIAREQGNLINLNEAYQQQMKHHATAPSWAKINWDAWQQLQFKLADLTVTQNKWLVGDEAAWLDAADSWPPERNAHAQAIRYFIWKKHTDKPLQTRAQQAWINTFAKPDMWNKAWLERYKDEIDAPQQQYLGLQLLNQDPTMAVSLLRLNPAPLTREQTLAYVEGALDNQDATHAWGALLQSYNKAPQWSAEEVQRLSPSIVQLLRLPSSMNNQMLLPLIETLQQNAATPYKQAINIAFAQRLLLQGDSTAAGHFAQYAIQAGAGESAQQLYEQSMQTARLKPSNPKLATAKDAQNPKKEAVKTKQGKKK